MIVRYWYSIPAAPPFGHTSGLHAREIHDCEPLDRYLHGTCSEHWKSMSFENCGPSYVFCKEDVGCWIWTEVMPLNELGPQGRVIQARWLPHFLKTLGIPWPLDLDKTSWMKNLPFLRECGKVWRKPIPRLIFWVPISEARDAWLRPFSIGLSPSLDCGCSGNLPFRHCMMFRYHVNGLVQGRPN